MGVELIRIYINNDLDIVTARMQVREKAKEIGFGTADQARISLAVSELARILSWKSDRHSEIIMSDAQQDNGNHGVQVICSVSLDLISSKASVWTGDNSVPRRSLASARQLVDESKVEMLDGNLARVILLQWFKERSLQ